MATDAKSDLFSYQRKGYRAYALVLLTFVYCVNFVDRQVLAVLMPAIKSDMQLSDTQLGFLSGIAFALLYSTVGIPIAKWADRGNRRNITALAIAIWSAMTVLCGFAQNVVQLILARAGVAIGEAGGTPPSHSIIADIFSEESRATALAIYGLGIQFGILTGLMFGGWLAQHFDWRIAFMVVGAPGLLVAAIVRFTLKEPERPTEYHAFQKTSRSSIKEALGWMFSFPSFRHLAMGTTLLAIVGYGFGQWAPSFLVRTYDVSIGYAGFSLGIVLGVGGGVGTFLGGYLSDRLSTKGDRRWYLWMPGLAALLYVPLSWLFYFSDRVEVSLFLMFVPVALSVSFVGPVHALTQAIAGPNRRAMASGIVILLMTLVGLGLGPQVVGLISDLLNPAFGVNSLKYALLCVTTTAAAWSAAHYLLAARHIRSDLERASTNAVLTR